MKKALLVLAALAFATRVEAAPPTAEQLLMFFGEVIGPYYYNRGLNDAQAVFARVSDSFNDEIYGLEQREARTK